MRSKKTFLPIWPYLFGKGTKKAKEWLALCALELEVNDIPDIKEIDRQEFMQCFLQHENIFKYIPLDKYINLCKIFNIPNSNKCIYIVNIKNIVNNKDLQNLYNVIRDISFYENRITCLDTIKDNIKSILDKYGIKYKPIKFSFEKLSDYEIKYIIKYIPDKSNSLLSIRYEPHFLRKENNSYHLDSAGEKACIDYIIAYSTHIGDDATEIDKPIVPLKNLLTADNKRVQIPVLRLMEQTGENQGLWDAWIDKDTRPDPNYYLLADLDQECVAANPWNAIQTDSSVTIDFGTSSTVAAVRESDGRVRLLRIGDALSAPDATEDNSTLYENPTTLEFSHFKDFLLPWRNEPWRPGIEWKQVKFSHQAKNELKNEPQRGVKNIKTWARAQPGARPLRLRDEDETDIEFTPLPVEAEEQDPGDVEHRPVDLIEIYAYFLGLMLNNQIGFGGHSRIYCDYTMTFPVKFPQETRKRILQGFRRGLLRSMPPSLAYSARWQREHPFRLNELGSEPTALAAAMLPALGIQPTDEGTAFGVFDFGGGTTDFAFGLYRTPTDEEADSKGWEQVVDILDVAGDESLGGEKLLDLLAFEVIRENKRVCLEEGIVLLCPAGQTPFDGSEMLFSETWEARANTEVLREALRSLWEKGSFEEETGQISLSLSKCSNKTEKAQAASGDSNKANIGVLGEPLRSFFEKGLFGEETGQSFLSLSKCSNKTEMAQAASGDSNKAIEKVQVALSIDEEALCQCLYAKIRDGVKAFFNAFRQAFANSGLAIRTLHILLAGNSCRSPLVATTFQECIDEITPTQKNSILVHRELIPGQPEDKAPKSTTPQLGLAGTLRPTLKTGVAMGLLCILPGEHTGVVARTSQAQNGEAPFLFSVGTFKKDILVPCLRRNATYGKWLELGKVYENGVTVIGFSSSPLAMEDKIARGNCPEQRIKWGPQNAGRSIRVRPVNPREIELALWNEEQDTPDTSTQRTITLTKQG